MRSCSRTSVPLARVGVVLAHNDEVPLLEVVWVAVVVRQASLGLLHCVLSALDHKREFTSSPLPVLRENHGWSYVLMVIGHAQGPLCQMITEYGVNSHAHDALPTTGKTRCTRGLK